MRYNTVKYNEIIILLLFILYIDINSSPSNSVQKCFLKRVQNKFQKTNWNSRNRAKYLGSIPNTIKKCYSIYVEILFRGYKQKI